MRHCTLLLLLCCGMIHVCAQDARARLMRGFPADHVYTLRDTATILDILNVAWSCVTKPGEEKVDIDSARYLGTLAMTYSKKIGFATVNASQARRLPRWHMREGM